MVNIILMLKMAKYQLIEFKKICFWGMKKAWYHFGWISLILGVIITFLFFFFFESSNIWLFVVLVLLIEDMSWICEHMVGRCINLGLSLTRVLVYFIVFLIAIKIKDRSITVNLF
jgi:hypothetical protein